MDWSEDDTLCTDRIAIFSALLVLFSVILFVSVGRNILSFCGNVTKRSDRYYSFIFYLAILLISCGRVLYSVIMIVEASHCEVYSSIANLKEFLLLFPGRFYVNIFFAILLYWKDTLHHFVEAKQDSILLILFYAVNAVLFALMVTDAAVVILVPLKSQGYMIYSMFLVYALTLSS